MRTFPTPARMIKRFFNQRALIGLLVFSAVLIVTHHVVDTHFSFTTAPSLIPDANPDSPSRPNGDSKSWGLPVDWGNRLLDTWLSRGKEDSSLGRCPQLPSAPLADPIHTLVIDEKHSEDEENEDVPGVRTSYAASKVHHKAVVPSGQKLVSPKPPKDPLRPSKMIKHALGFNFMENVYMANGTIFAITEDSKTWPPIRFITSTGGWAENTPKNIAAREPTSEHMMYITMSEAQKRWGDRVYPVDGMTVLINDPGQFLSHYYHFVAETNFGWWRLYSSLDPNIDVNGNTVLAPPDRIVLPHCEAKEWRDYSQFNQYFIHGIFPGVGIETAIDWEGRRSFSAPHPKGLQKVWRFDKLLFVDRSAAFRGQLAPNINHRIAAEPWTTTRDISSKWWWEPIRRSFLRVAGVEQKVMDLPAMWLKDWDSVSNGDVEPTEKEVQVGRTAAQRMPVVVSYIVRSGNRRSMIREDHEALVKALTELCNKKKWELNVVYAEKLSREEQVQIAARTTVLLGIHGNGLTHLLWMPLTPLSTVIEIFVPGGFAKDYEWTSRSLGMRHYAIWNDTAYTHPDEPRVFYPPDFQGNKIPCHAPTVAKLIQDRVEGRLP